MDGFTCVGRFYNRKASGDCICTLVYSRFHRKIFCDDIIEFLELACGVSPSNLDLSPLYFSLYVFTTSWGFIDLYPSTNLAQRVSNSASLVAIIKGTTCFSLYSFSLVSVASWALPESSETAEYSPAMLGSWLQNGDKIC